MRTLLLAVLLCAPVRADELTAAKRADIKRLLRLLDAAKISRDYASSGGRAMLRALRLSRPGLPESAQGVIEDAAAKVYFEKMDRPDGLLDRMVPVYAGHYTHQEIKEMLAFYETPTGRKAIATMPDVFREMVDVATRWAKTLRPEILKRAEAALDKKAAAEPRP